MESLMSSHLRFCDESHDGPTCNEAHKSHDGSQCDESQDGTKCNEELKPPHERWRFLADDYLASEKRNFVRTDEVGMPGLLARAAMSLLSDAQHVGNKTDANDLINSAKMLLGDLMERVPRP